MWYTRKRAVESIAADLISTPDGITVTPTLGRTVPSEGYAVGQGGISGELTVGQVAQWVEDNLAEVTSKGWYFGSWIDQESGMVYLDKVKIFPELVPACRDADKRGELAIFDLGRKVEIRQTEYVTRWDLADL